MSMIDQFRQFLRSPWTAGRVWALVSALLLGLALIVFIGIESRMEPEHLKGEASDCDIWAIEPGEPVPEGC